MIFSQRTVSAAVWGGVFAIWLAFGPGAYAHAQLVKAEPARRATMLEAPNQVRLWFNEEIEKSYASVTVLDSAGNAVTAAKPAFADDDRKSLALALPPLLPGKYKVKFRVLSVDGHVVESSYEFTVKEKLPEKK